MINGSGLTGMTMLQQAVTPWPALPPDPPEWFVTGAALAELIDQVVSELRMAQSARDDALAKHYLAEAELHSTTSSLGFSRAKWEQLCRHLARTAGTHG